VSPIEPLKQHAKDPRNPKLRTACGLYFENSRAPLGEPVTCRRCKRALRAIHGPPPTSKR
jgi:hypothetical protein